MFFVKAYALSDRFSPPRCCSPSLSCIFFVPIDRSVQEEVIELRQEFDNDTPTLKSSAWRRRSQTSSNSFLGYVHKYPESFRKTELFDPGYIETVNIRTYPELFARAPKRSFQKRSRKRIFRKRRFWIRIFFFLNLRVNMVSGSFLPLFPRRSKMARPNDVYCFTCICSLVAETGGSSFIFCFEGSCLRKQNGGCLLALPQHQHTSILCPDVSDRIALSFFKELLRMVAVVFRSNSTSSSS